MARAGGSFRWRVTLVWAVTLVLGVAACLEEAPPAPAPPEPGAQQAARFEQDPEAVRTFQRVRGDFRRYGYPLSEDVEAIRRLHAQYPSEELIVEFLDRLLLSLVDYEGMYELHAARPAERRTLYQSFYLGYLLVQMARFEQAAEHLMPLARAHPNDPHIALQAAVSLVSLTRYDEAEELLSRPGVDKVDPAGVALLRGQMRLRQGAFEEAQGHLLRALNLRADYVPAAHAMVRTLYGMGDREGAAEYARLAAEIGQRQEEDQRFHTAVWSLSVEWRQSLWEDCVTRINGLLDMVEDPLGKAALLFLRSKAYDHLGRAGESAADLCQAEAYRDEFGSGLLGPPSSRAQTLMRQAAALTN